MFSYFALLTLPTKSCACGNSASTLGLIFTLLQLLTCLYHGDDNLDSTMHLSVKLPFWSIVYFI
jgi:hypothetical protein